MTRELTEKEQQERDAAWAAGYAAALDSPSVQELRRKADAFDEMVAMRVTPAAVAELQKKVRKESEEPRYELSREEKLIAAEDKIKELREKVATLSAHLADVQMNTEPPMPTEVEELREAVKVLRYNLSNIVTLIKGECPSLIEDDHNFDRAETALAATAHLEEQK